jgi:DNA invertase Pin-like site-specific DNA recombinase
MREVKPIVVYYRVSTKRQGESGLGLDAQRTYVKHFYTQEPIAEFVETVSGKDVLNRPKLLEALELCKQQKATLVVAKIDRLSRRTEQALNIYSELEGRLESCDVPNLDKFTLTLFMAIADRERELISLRTKAALDEKRKKLGEWRKPSVAFTNGSASTLGVVAIQEKAKANSNNRKASALVNSLRNFQNMTWREIAEELNKDGFKTSRGGNFQATQAMRLYSNT